MYARKSKGKGRGEGANTFWFGAWNLIAQRHICVLYTIIFQSGEWKVNPYWGCKPSMLKSNKKVFFRMKKRVKIQITQLMKRQNSIIMASLHTFQKKYCGGRDALFNPSSDGGARGKNIAWHMRLKSGWISKIVHGLLTFDSEPSQDVTLVILLQDPFS